MAPNPKPNPVIVPVTSSQGPKVTRNTNRPKSRVFVLICRNGKPVAEMKAVKVAIGRLASDPALKVTFAPGFDPAEPATEEDWPEEKR